MFKIVYSTSLLLNVALLFIPLAMPHVYYVSGEMVFRHFGLGVTCFWACFNRSTVTVGFSYENTVRLRLLQLHCCGGKLKMSKQTLVNYLID